MKADELIPVIPMSAPRGLDFFINEYVYDLGNGVELTTNECLKLIDWWEMEKGMNIDFCYI